MNTLYSIGLKIFTEKDGKGFLTDFNKDKMARNEHRASMIEKGVSMAGGLVGLAGGLKGLKTQIPHFTVIFKSDKGIQQKTVKANTPLDAQNKALAGVNNPQNVRAFRIPEQDDESQDYYNTLRSNN